MGDMIDVLRLAMEYGHLERVWRGQRQVSYKIPNRASVSLVVRYLSFDFPPHKLRQ